MSCTPSERVPIGELRCDGWSEGCPNERVMVLDNPRDGVTPGGALGERLLFAEDEARAYVAQFGWVFEDGRDLCPGCKVRRVAESSQKTC